MNSRLWKNEFLKFIIVPLLVIGLAFPQGTWAANPADSKHGQSTRPGPDGSTFLTLGDLDDADGFADRLIKSLPVDGENEVHLFHIQGLAPDPRLQRILVLLVQNGVKVQGTYVTQKRFEEIVANYEIDEEAPEKIEKYLVTYKTPSVPQDRGWLSWLKPQNLLKGLGELKRKLFGLPRGISVFTHFVKKAADGSWHRRFPSDIKTTLFALGTSVWGIGNLTLVRALGPSLFGMPAQPMDAEFWVINGIVFAWIFLFLNFQREVSSFRSQGASVRVDASAVEGKQIEVVPNESFFSAACVGEGWILNGLLTALLMATGSVSPTVAVVGNAAMNGVLSAWSFVVPEDIKARWLAEAEAIKNTDPEKAAKLNAKALALATVFWNLIFPTFKNLNLFLPGWLTSLPFVILGSMGLGWKGVTEWRRSSAATIANKAAAANAPVVADLPHRCSAQLWIRSKKKI